ncbi:glycosyltransferase [Curtobacterium sp. UCD-KPL2560]|uniref:glycosyltransferase n=1 Tax=Curtobacterium sp. UCD-KPL2560 TaxID=1885315 RepID=UPI0009F1C3C7|nr:glycosyltransferase [Curtobacterium sp. UCD-KPL2560]
MSRLSVAYVASTQYDGGAERHVIRLAALMGELCPAFIIGGFGRDGAIEQQARNYALGGKWVTRNLPSAFVRLPVELWRARKIARTRPASVYHMHFKREQIGFSKSFSKLGRVVWTEHGVFPGSIFGAVLKPLYRRASRNVHTIICVSDRVRDSIEEVLGSSQKLVVIPNAVDVQQLRAARESLRSRTRQEMGFNDTDRVALIIGRLSPSKRPRLAIEAALDGRCKVIVAGAGVEAAALRHDFAPAGVRFLGSVADPRPLWAAADVHLFLSNGEGEGLPTVLLEAGAAGVPTVISSDCGFADLATGMGGVAVDPVRDRVSRALSEWEFSDAVPSIVDAYDTRRWIQSHNATYLDAVRERS